MNVLFFQFGKYLLVEDLRVSLLQLVCGSGYCLHLLVWGEPGGGWYGEPGGDTAFEPGHSHHEEFVKVRGHDRKKIQPFQQVQVGVFGEFEHARIKVEPAAFAVEEPFGAEIAFKAGQGDFFACFDAVAACFGALNL